MKLLAAALMLLASACNVDAWDSPRALETPQQGMPCGAAWHPCGDAGTCCANTQACMPNGGECETVLLVLAGLALAFTCWVFGIGGGR